MKRIMYLGASLCVATGLAVVASPAYGAQDLGVASETVEAEQLKSTGSNLISGAFVGLVLVGLGLLALRCRRIARS